MNALLNISGKNLLPFSGMEDWVNGASSAPTDHTLTGASATVAQEATTVKRGTYSAKVTRAGADATLYYDLGSLIYVNYKGHKMTLGVWVLCSSASTARIQIDDGVGTSNSSFHTGDGTWQFLTVTRDIDPSATRIRSAMQVNTNNVAAYFDGGIFVEGATAFTDLSSYLEEWKPGKHYRMSKFLVARRPGAIVPFNEHDSKTISVTGKVVGTTPTAARTSFDALMQSLNDSEKDLYLYDDRFLRVFVQSQDENYIAALRVIPFTLQFFAQTPFYLSAQKYRNQQVIAASPTTFTLTTNGNTYSKPKIRITAGGSDVTSCTIENLTTGQLWAFTATITAGTYMEVDFFESTVLNNSVDSLQYSVGDFPQFQLNPGANQIRFTGSNCTIASDWYDRWL